MSPLPPRLTLLATLAALTLAACARPDTAPADPRWGSLISERTYGTISKRDRITIVFTRDVAGEYLIGRPTTGVLVLEPEVEGAATFVSARELVFAPAADLPSGQAFRATLVGEGLLGLPEDLGDYGFDFEVMAQSFEVDVAGLDAVSGDEDDLVLTGTITTADFAEAEAVEGILSAEQDGTGLEIRWRHEEDGISHDFAVQGVTRLAEEDQVVRLRWNGGSIGVSSRGGGDVSVPAEDAFLVTGVRAESEDRQYALVRFSDPLDPNQNLSGLVSLGEEGFTLEVAGNTLRVIPAERVVGPLNVVIEEGVLSAGGKRLDERSETEVTFVDVKPGVRFAGRGVVLPRADRLTVPIEAANVHSVQVTGFRVYESNVGQFLQTNSLSGGWQLERTGRTLWRRNIELPVAPDGGWTRYTLDVSDIVRAQAGSLVRLTLSINRGNSTFACSEEQDRIPVLEEPWPADLDAGDGSVASNWNAVEESYQGSVDWRDRNDPCVDAYFRWSSRSSDSRNFLASNIGMTAKRDARGGTLVAITDLRTSEPMRGVAVTFMNYQHQPLGTVVTGPGGLARTTLQPTPYYAVAIRGGETGYLKMSPGAALPTSHFDVGGQVVAAGLKGAIYARRRGSRRLHHGAGAGRPFPRHAHGEVHDARLRAGRCLQHQPAQRAFLPLRPVRRRQGAAGRRTPRHAPHRHGAYRRHRDPLAKGRSGVGRLGGAHPLQDRLALVVGPLGGIAGALHRVRIQHGGGAGTRRHDGRARDVELRRQLPGLGPLSVARMRRRRRTLHREDRVHRLARMGGPHAGALRRRGGRPHPDGRHDELRGGRRGRDPAAGGELRPGARDAGDRHPDPRPALGGDGRRAHALRGADHRRDDPERVCGRQPDPAALGPRQRPADPALRGDSARCRGSGDGAAAAGCGSRRVASRHHRHRAGVRGVGPAHDLHPGRRGRRAPGPHQLRDARPARPLLQQGGARDLHLGHLRRGGRCVRGRAGAAARPGRGRRGRDPGTGAEPLPAGGALSGAVHPPARPAPHALGRPPGVHRAGARHGRRGPRGRLRFGLRVGLRAAAALAPGHRAPGRGSGRGDHRAGVALRHGRRDRAGDRNGGRGRAVPGGGECERDRHLLEARLGYLVRYPHGCLEQVVSAVFAQMYLPLLVDLDADDRTDVEENVRAGIDRLRGFQAASGGFLYWPGAFSAGNARNGWVTNYAGHFLIEAERLGYYVDPEMISDWRAYQRRRARSWRNGGGMPAMVQAYRLYTLALAGDYEVSAMNRLRQSAGLEATARWHLAAAYGLAGVEEAAGRLVRADDVAPGYAVPGWSMGSPLRDRGILLEALVTLDREAHATRVAEEISAALYSDDWHGTHSVAYALLAMARFHGLGEAAGEFTFERRAGDDVAEAVSSSPVYSEDLAGIAEGGGRVEVRNTSDAPLFASLVTRGSPAAGDEAAASSGLSVGVVYTDPDGAVVDVFEVVQGTDLMARVTVSNESGRDLRDLALEYRAPSGWEIHNARMDAGEGPVDDRIEYRDVRDDRVLTYFSLGDGEALELSMRFNAAYLGDYYLPTVSVEAMYDASVYGRIRGMAVRVVDEGEEG